MAPALDAYQQAGRLHVVDTRDAARAELVDQHRADHAAAPERGQLVLAYRNDEVYRLSADIRAGRQAADELSSPGVRVALRISRKRCSGSVLGPRPRPACSQEPLRTTNAPEERGEGRFPRCPGQDLLLDLKVSDVGDAMALSGHRGAAVALRYHQAGAALSNPAPRLADY